MTENPDQKSDLPSKGSSTPPFLKKLFAPFPEERINPPSIPAPPRQASARPHCIWNPLWFGGQIILFIFTLSLLLSLLKKPNASSGTGLLWLGIPLFLVAFIYFLRFFLRMSKETKKRKWLAQNGISAKGIITKTSVKKTSLFRRHSRTFILYYEFTDLLGKKIKAEGFFEKLLYQGLEVAVLYNPQDPYESILYCETQEITL
jgi:hypothetical protein